MCAQCAVDQAAKAKDWDEVIRVAREEKKAEKADEKAEVEEKAEVRDDLKVEKHASKASSK